MKAIRGTRQEQIQGAYDMWQKAKAGVQIAQKTYARVKNLNAEGVLPAQKLDEAIAQRDAAVATERAAHSQYTMAVNGAQREDKDAAAALVQRAKGAVAEVNSYIKETYLIAPCDGEVTETYPQVGELVGTGAPIMSIAIMMRRFFYVGLQISFILSISLAVLTSLYCSDILHWIHTPQNIFHGVLHAETMFRVLAITRMR